MVLEKQPGNQRAAVYYDNIVLPNIVTLFLLDLLSLSTPSVLSNTPRGPNVTERNASFSRAIPDGLACALCLWRVGLLNSITGGK